MSEEKKGQNANIEDEKDRGEIARQAFFAGCNCAQSVVCAFSEYLDCDRETLLRLCSGLGGGIGRLREVCGAFLGAVLVLDGVLGSADPTDRAAKADQYRRIQSLAEEFRRTNGSLYCREMLGLPAGASEPVPERRTAEYYRKRPCPQIIYEAAAMTDRVIREQKMANGEKIGERDDGFIEKIEESHNL